MHKPFILLIVSLIFISCNPGSKKEYSPKWKQEFPGVWKSKVNKPGEFNLLSVSDKNPRKEILEKADNCAFPIDVEDIKITSSEGKTSIRFPLERDEQVYGLGLNFKTVQQRGKILRLHVDHYGGRDNGRTHAPVPFFVTSRGYGVFINAAKYIDVYVGTGVRKDSKNPPVVRDRNSDPEWSAMPYSDNIEIVIPGNGAEMVLFAGPAMIDVVKRFNLYCGGGIIPPKWGLGFWHRTPTKYTDARVQYEVAQFKERNFPLDVIGLEPGWHSKAYPCTFEWDKERFPAPSTFVKEMQNDGINLNLWANPYLSPEGDLYEKMLPYTGTHTVWCGTVPDYTMPEAREIMQNHITKHQLDIGISGYKIDEVDGIDSWIWPDAAHFPSGLDGEQMRQTYGVQMMSLLDNAYRKINRRTYGLIRAANAGSVAYPYVIYNDYYRHQDFITALINSGFNGVLWTPEVRSGRMEEEWVRRMQSVCFSPLAMINAWADGTKPWSFPEVYDYCSEVAFLRMQLLPYIYSTFAQYYFEGIPPFRAMELVEGYNAKTNKESGNLDSSENPYALPESKEIKDQYMMGDFILVAPMFAYQEERTVVLPKGNWYDFYTGKYAGNGEIITVSAGLDKIPLFVMDGGIIPMMPPIRQTKEWKEDTPLEIRVYGKAGNSFVLYDDDGSTYDFEKGNYTTKLLTVKEGKGIIEKVHSRGPWTYGEISWKFMTN
jgi:alpha-D-xyloside xylohydrolase